MDGVVFDTERIYRMAWRRAADDLGGIPEIDADIRVCTGRNNADIGTYFHGKYGKEFPYETLMARRSVHIDEYIRANGLPFKPGVPEIFSWLHGNRLSRRPCHLHQSEESGGVSGTCGTRGFV